MGGKTLLGKEISQVLKQHCSNNIKGYLEPFCGSLGVTKYMVDDYYCVVSDIHPDLIMLWNEVKDGTFVYPEEITKEEWLKYKVSPPSAMRAFYGFGLSFGGMWFSSYAPLYSRSKSVLNETINSIKRQEQYIKKINEIIHCSYDTHKPEGMLIYCDPPYKNTEKYSNGKFDSNKFWETVRHWSKNNIVIVSEFEAPDDFKCIWEKERKVRINQKNPKIKIEKLFMKI